MLTSSPSSLYWTAQLTLAASRVLNNIKLTQRQVSSKTHNTTALTSHLLMCVLCQWGQTASLANNRISLFPLCQNVHWRSYIRFSVTQTSVLFRTYHKIVILSSVAFKEKLQIISAAATARDASRLSTVVFSFPHFPKVSFYQKIGPINHVGLDHRLTRIKRQSKFY